jgi:hypothetical protein
LPESSLMVGGRSGLQAEKELQRDGKKRNVSLERCDIETILKEY